MLSESPPLCPWCHQPARLVWVHGHGQCEHCRTNVEPCCSGDECPVEIEDDAGGDRAD